MLSQQVYNIYCFLGVHLYLKTVKSEQPPYTISQDKTLSSEREGDQSALTYLKGLITCVQKGLMRSSVASCRLGGPVDYWVLPRRGHNEVFH
jgi:hypothetical protein